MENSYLAPTLGDKIQWVERIVSVDSLKPFERNPRKISKESYAALKASLNDMGYHQRIIAQPDLSIIGGHQRIKALKECGFKEIAVLVPDRSLTDDEFRRLLVTDNLPFGDFDFPMLAVDYDIGELAEWGMSDKMLAGMPQIAQEGLTDADEVPEPPEKVVTVPGDLWLLGNHRLMCGDSTLIDSVDKLMDGQKADMVFTDPPWNVNYGAVQKGNPQNNKLRTIINDFQNPEDWKKFCADISDALFAASKPGAALYLVMSAQEWPVMDAALRPHFHWSSTIIWNKDQLVLSRKDYHTQYEPIWYGWNNAAARLVPLTDRKQSDVWEIPRPKSSELHPTMKPVELVIRAIKNSSTGDDIVLDLFGGSGSTLIAAEQTGRKGYLVELDPKYCDVIINRWQNFTGKTATHAVTGEPYARINT